MCLAVPARITAIEDMLATVDIDGVTRQASLMLLPGAAVGDFVLVHAGFAIQVIDEEEARRTLDLLKEMAGYEDEEA